MRETDLAYIAGIIDGEGTIGARSNVSPKKCLKRYDVGIRIEMVDKPPLELAQYLFGGNIRSRRARKANWKPLWVWLITGDKAIVAIKELLPYLLIKKAQAEVGLRILLDRPKGRHYTSMERFLQEADGLALRELNR